MYLNVKALIMVRIGMTCNHIEKEIEVDYEPSLNDFNEWTSQYTNGKFTNVYDFIKAYYEEDYDDYKELIEEAMEMGEKNIFFTENLIVYESDLKKSFHDYLVNKYEEAFVQPLLEEIDSKDLNIDL